MILAKGFIVDDGSGDNVCPATQPNIWILVRTGVNDEIGACTCSNEMLRV